MTMPPLHDTFEGRHLIMTGVTGFVGKVWLSMMLHHFPDVGRITCLVRPGRRESAQERLARLLDTSPVMRPVKADQGDQWQRFLNLRVEVLASDISAPDLGLDPQTLERLRQTADAVVHFAGLTDFHPDPQKGLPANAFGALHVGRFAQSLRTPRLVHVSTCYVAGLAEGHVPETLEPGMSPLGVMFDAQQELDDCWAEISEIDDADARTDHAAARAEALGWPNLYTYSKGLAEHLLAGLRDLELTIVRPSVVECSRSFPFSGWNEGLNTSAPIMWFCGTPFQELPATGAHNFDIVPVDTVCRATTLATALLLHGEAKPVYQVASSDLNPATFDRIVELTALGKRRAARRGGSDWMDRLSASLDIQPVRREDSASVDPEQVQGWLKSAHDFLGDLKPGKRLPGALGRTVNRRVRKLRSQLRKESRRMGKLHDMLDIYRPFIHDYNWAFASDNYHALLSELAPQDHAAFSDDVRDICWRDYWLNVQYPGVSKWSFPIMENEEPPTDPPSVPPLQLRSPSAQTAKGAA